MILNSFLDPLSESKPFLIIQLAPPKYILGISNSFKSTSPPLLFYAEFIFTGNDDAIHVDPQDAKIFFKDIHAKRMDSVYIINMDKNLIRTVSEIL